MSNVNENTNVTVDVDETATATATVTTPEVTPEEPELLLGVVTDCAKLNVRKAPEVTAPIICTIPRDTEVEVLFEESTDEFYKVLTATGVEGFCMAKYIAIEE